VTPTKAVVLVLACGDNSGGSGAGMRGGTLPPAPLLPVANRALLAHALEWLTRAGVREAAVVVPGDLAARARTAAGEAEPGMTVSWVEQLPGETLAQTLHDLTGFLEGESFVLHMADSLARQSLGSLTFAAADAEEETLLLVDESSRVELAQVLQLRAAVNGGRTFRRALRRDAGGVAVVAPGALAAAGDLDLQADRLLEGLADCIQQHGGRVRTRGVSEWWRFRGGADALLEGNRFALEGRRADYAMAEVVNSEIQGPVIAHPEARIEASVVRGPSIVGARARLCEAYVGPYTSVGEDVAVEGAEIEHSVILPGASIRHLGTRLEASVIGPRSRVFRDFRLPRALRLTLGEGAEVSLT
jgi:glucose-1-phosphate thymidylyltransferase